jgi:hypothetical protein
VFSCNPFPLLYFFPLNLRKWTRKHGSPSIVQCSRGLFGWQGMADKAQPAPPGNTPGADGRIHIQPIPDRKPRYNTLRPHVHDPSPRQAPFGHVWLEPLFYSVRRFPFLPPA